MKEITLTINGLKVKGAPGDSVLAVCQTNGIDVPTLCHLDGLTDLGGCRMCVVEIDGERRPVPSCTYTAKEGLVVRTSTKQLEAYRRLLLELLFTERNHFCMYCEKSGDCELQKLAYRYQMDNIRFDHHYPSLPMDSLSDSIVIDHNRCVLCGRCIRECAEIAGRSTLDFGNRGWRTMVIADLAQPLAQSSCTSCGACVQVCPTGAIFSKLSLYRGVTADCQRVTTVCPECGVACSLDVLVKDKNIIRIEASNPAEFTGVLCWKGRFGLLNETRRRIKTPLIRDRNGSLRESSWDEAADVIAAKVDELGGAFAGMVSPRIASITLAAFGEFMEKVVGTTQIDTTDGPLYRSIRRAITGLQDNARGLNIECRLDEILKSDCILVVDADPLKTHPVVGNLILRAVKQNKAKVMVVDTSEDPLPFLTDLWLKPEKGREEPLVTCLARLNILNKMLVLEKADSGGLTESLIRDEKKEASAITGIDEEVLERAAEMYGTARHAVIIYGGSLLKAPEPETITSLLKMARVTGNNTGDSLRVLSLKPGANSRGAWQLGLAEKGFDWDAVTGMYLLLADDGIEEKVLSRLKKVDFLVVQTSHETAFTGMAHVVLPSLTWAERAGQYIRMDGEVLEARHVLEPPVGLLRDREIFQLISRKLGREAIKR
jgi:formate dehydrogenase major subunit